MVDDLQAALSLVDALLEEIPEAGHEWNSLDDYLYQHETRPLESGFVLEGQIEPAFFSIPNRPGVSILRLQGDLRCQGDIVIHVQKLALVRQMLRRSRRFEARTFLYGYHAYKPGGVALVRCDNWHSEVGREEHHRHSFHSATGADLGTRPCRWSHLHEFVEEVRAIASAQG